jgi:hypothetical protein
MDDEVIIMNGSRAAERCWDRHINYVKEHDMPDLAWDYFLDEAAEHEKFADDNGEWLEGFPEKLDETKEWDEYCIDFCNMLESLHEAWRDYNECRGDPYAYYGVSRSDFA